MSRRDGSGQVRSRHVGSRQGISRLVQRCGLHSGSIPEALIVHVWFCQVVFSLVMSRRG